jgi:hypothetical protein
MHNVLLMVIQNVVKSNLVFFETVKERCIGCFQTFIIVVHENDRVETLMDEALRVQLGSKCDSAVPFFSIYSKVLIEQVIQAAVDIFHII